MEKPTLQEWLRQNPGKGVNDYFQKYPGRQSEKYASYENTTPTIPSSVNP